jgi:hypothetical protein
MTPRGEHSIIALITVAILFSASSAARPQQVSTGILNIDSTPSGAEVFLDNKLRGTTPILLEVQALPHKVVLKHDGYRQHTSQITVKKNKVIRTRIKLRKETRSAELKPSQPHSRMKARSKAKDDPVKKSRSPNAIRVKDGIKIHSAANNSAPGTVFLDTTPMSLTASIDGFRISKKTPVAFDIRPGIYELMLYNNKNEIVYNKTIFVRSGKTLSLDIVIQKKRTIDYTDPWR